MYSVLPFKRKDGIVGNLLSTRLEKCMQVSCTSHLMGSQLLSADLSCSLVLFLTPGGAGAISSLIHDGFMNPIEGVCVSVCACVNACIWYSCVYMFALALHTSCLHCLLVQVAFMLTMHVVKHYGIGKGIIVCDSNKR